MAPRSPWFRPPADPTRRRVLAGLGVLAAATGTGLLAGCGSGSATPAQTTTSLGAAASGPSRLGARFADGYVAPTALAAGTPQRAPYVVLGADGWPLVDEAPDAVDLVLRAAGTDGTPGPVVASATVARHGAGQATPYYPFWFTAPDPGDFVVEASVGGAALAEVHHLRLADPTNLALVQVGDPLPTVATPTLDDPRGVDPVCTLAGGPCRFHATSLDATGDHPRPTALLVSTPRFCQQDVCGPTVGLLEDALAARPTGEVWRAVHAEVYVAPDVGDFTPTPVVGALGLAFEPSLVVADAAGTVTAALHFTMDAAEVAGALATAT